MESLLYSLSSDSFSQYQGNLNREVRVTVGAIITGIAVAAMLPLYDDVSDQDLNAPLDKTASTIIELLEMYYEPLQFVQNHSSSQ